MFLFLMANFLNLAYTANQDVHTLTQKSSSIFPITLFNLQLETSLLHFKMYINRATKKYKCIDEIQPKVRPG